MNPVSLQWNDMVESRRRKYGPAFVEPKVHWTIKAYCDGRRVEVVSPSGWVRRGVISFTTGPQVAPMLMHRRSDSGSWDLLREGDIVTARIDYRGGRHLIKDEDLQFQAACYRGTGGS